MKLDARVTGAATAVVAVVVLLGSEAAHSSWSGDEGAAADGAGQLVVNQLTEVRAMRPGLAPQTLSGDFDNTSGSLVRVEAVVARIAAVEIARDVPAVGCSAADFTLTGATMPAVQEVEAGDGQGAWTGASIAFNTTDQDQNACKGVTVRLSYAAR